MSTTDTSEVQNTKNAQRLLKEIDEEKKRIESFGKDDYIDADHLVRMMAFATLREYIRNLEKHNQNLKEENISLLSEISHLKANED